MSAEFQYDVFLSHNHADKPKVRRLAERLKAAGVRVWLDEWVIQAGDIIALKVDEGLEQSRVLLLCISPAALASGWVALERSTAIHRDPANVGRRFIPLLMGDCDLPDTLRRYKYVDFREESDSGFEELCLAGQTVQKAPPSATDESPKILPQTSNAADAQSNTDQQVILEDVLTGHESSVEAIAESNDGTWFATGSPDGDVIVWSTDTRSKLTILNAMPTCKHWRPEFEFPPPQILISDDDRTILSASGSLRILRVWNRQKNIQTPFLWKGLNEATTASLAANGRWVLTASRYDELRLWNIASGKCIKTFSAQGQIECIQISSDGEQAICGYKDGMVRIFLIRKGKIIHAWQAHTNKVCALRIAKSSQEILTTSTDTTIRIWRMNSGECLGTLEGHRGEVGSLAVSQNNLVIASSSRTEKLVRIWDRLTGRCIYQLAFEHDEPEALHFTPDGKHLFVGTKMGNVHYYRLAESLGSIAAEPTRRYLNAKVVLIGEGTVGKTSLAHRMIEDRYIVGDRTHGMNVWKLELPQDHFPEGAKVIEEREVLLWDLAGQEDYRLIHQLFLEETALAVLLINPQREDPFAEAGDWLKALKVAVSCHDTKRDVAKLLIFSQIDVGGMKVGNTKIDRFRQQHGFVGWLPTSAKTGENCSDKENGGRSSKLKQLISAGIPWDNLPWTSTPRLLAALKSAVMAMRDELDIRLLRFSELAQRLEQALQGDKFVESDVRTAVTLLANHGLARPLKFGDLVLLRPDLLSGYAGAIIREARAHTDEIGCVLEADIYRPDFDFTGVERLKHRPDEELLLRALVQTFLDHALCIAEETPQGRHLVFPSQYRREKDLPHEPDIFVSYNFSGEWQTVWTTLVVRLWYSQEFAHRELWRNAAEFESVRKQTLGLKITKTGDGAATISLYFDHGLPDELKVIFIEYVHRHLARYACEVTRDRRYVCPGCGKPVKDIDAVRRRLEAKKAFITCQECDEKVPFIDFIEQRLKSDPVARKILAMDETATRGLDTQALEQILIGHVQAITGEANQIFRELTKFDYGIDGEVEFKDNDGKASGKRIYIQLKSGNSYLRTRKGDGSEVFDVKDERHLEYWISQPVDVYLVIRQTDELSGQQIIRWMNVTRYLKERKDKQSRQIVFHGEKLDMEAVWKVRDGFFPVAKARR